MILHDVSKHWVYNPPTHANDGCDDYVHDLFGRVYEWGGVFNSDIIHDKTFKSAEEAMKEAEKVGKERLMKRIADNNW